MRFRWFIIASAGVFLCIAPPLDAADAAAVVPRDTCSAQHAAYEEVRLRAQASQTSLELLRNYRGDLDQAYQATWRAGYQEAVVDVASLASGWPLGSAAENYFLGTVKNTMTEKLIKAGFKSVNKALLKDPRLNTIFTQVTADPETLSGVQFDVMKQSLKNNAIELWGKEAGETVFGVFDLGLFAGKQYKGMKQLDAFRALGRSVDDHIVSLQSRNAEQVDVLENARHALNLCEDRVAKHLPPDNNNYFWRSVLAYLNAKPAAPPPRTIARPAPLAPRVFTAGQQFATPYDVRGTWTLVVVNRYTMTIDRQAGSSFSGYLNTGDDIVDGKINGREMTFTRKASAKSKGDWPDDGSGGPGDSSDPEQQISVTLTRFSWSGEGAWTGYHQQWHSQHGKFKLVATVARTSTKFGPKPE